MSNIKISSLKDPEIYLALKTLCKYVIDDVWDASMNAEYALALERSKEFKKDIETLAHLDSNLAWGQTKREIFDNTWTYTDEGSFNPWYNGNLCLEDLLQSLALLYEFIDSISPKYIRDAEFLHYYDFLYSKIPKNIPPPARISIQTLHPKVIEHTKSRFYGKHYSDAILAAYKVVLNEIKDVSGIKDLDGAKLVQQAFRLENPIIKLNPLITQSDRDEQQGFMLLFSGAAIGIRNPKAHDLISQDDREKTLAYLSFASLLMQKLDERLEPKIKERPSRK